MPMWQRINYLVGLTRPSNYTLQQYGGYMVPPMVQLTLGDFYKNHFVIITSCNVTIPDDASWETIPEESNQEWSYGPNKAIQWFNPDTIIDPRQNKATSKGRIAQFPRTAEISVQMNVLEKDRPKTGRAIWGNAPVQSISIDQAANTTFQNVDVRTLGTVDLEYTNKVQDDPSKNNFSTNVRYDTDSIGVQNSNTP